MTSSSHEIAYLDHQATTPVDPRVLDRMLPYFSVRFGNAASRQHAFGWDAAKAVDEGRDEVARLLGVTAKEIVFTSGATESNNLALKGVLTVNRGRRNPRDHVVTVVTEHQSVLDTCRWLEHQGYRVTYLPVGRDGLVDLDRVSAAVDERTAILSVMAAHNEIGVVQPIEELAEIAHEQGALLHSDAVQALGKVDLNAEASGIDLVSVTAHKLYGPKGVGALFVRRTLRGALDPLLVGGGHERGLRSGTLNVPGIVGFGAACALAEELMVAESVRLTELRRRLLDGLHARIDGLVVNGALDPRLPGNLNVSIPGIDGEALLLSLTRVAVSSGAACTAAQPSHVLKALGHSTDLALASIRFGLGRWTTEAEVDVAIDHVGSTVARLRAVATV